MRLRERGFGPDIENLVNRSFLHMLMQIGSADVSTGINIFLGLGRILDLRGLRLLAAEDCHGKHQYQKHTSIKDHGTFPLIEPKITRQIGPGNRLIPGIDLQSGYSGFSLAADNGILRRTALLNGIRFDENPVACITACISDRLRVHRKNALPVQ